MEDKVTKDLMDFDRALERAEKFSGHMKKAFRAGFEFLQAFYPPREDEQYWMELAEAARGKFLDDSENPLLVPMIVMVMDYLGDEIREMKKEEERADGQ